MAPLKLKLGTNKASSSDNAAPPTPSSVGSGPTPTSGTGIKLKINASQPPTPATEQPEQTSTKTTGKGAGQKARGGKAGAGSRKRAANEDISPAPKRPSLLAGASRTVSLSLKGPGAPSKTNDEAPTPTGSSKLMLKRRSTQPRLSAINVKQPPPKRIPGTGYDSEDSEAEKDPAIQQAFVLRMEPGEDCNYIREAIASGKIGLPQNEGPAEVSLRFLTHDHRRAIVTVRGRMYAAVLVDLPCIVETMKSWDKKGWWKVADICQMLLVLGRCSGDDEAKKFPLPREVDKETLQYAHGLTPPMKWVRKRRFRKRLNYTTIANVEEEVERMLKEDEQAESQGGKVLWEYLGRTELSRSEEPEQSQIDDEEEDDAIETVENGQEYDEYDDEDDEMGDVDLEGNLQAMFDEDHANASDEPLAAADVVTESPKPLADQAASFAAVETAMAGSDSPAPAGTPINDTTEQSQSSDEDEDDVSDEDEDSPDVMDEDAVAAAAERNQQLEELADLERDVQRQRAALPNETNQLLKEKRMGILRALEEDLRLKRSVLGLDEDGLEESEEAG